MLPLTPVQAQANTIWPFVAYYVQQEFLINLWTIGIGSTIEFVAVWILFPITPFKALAADVAMNVASTLLGLAMIYGLAWSGYSILGDYSWWFREPVAFATVIIINFLFVCLINASIESATLMWVFRLPLTGRRFGYLLLANGLSAAVSLSGVWAQTGGEPWVNPGSIV